MLNLLGSIVEFERGVMLMANIGARTRAA